MCSEYIYKKNWLSKLFANHFWVNKYVICIFFNKKKFLVRYFLEFRSQMNVRAKFLVRQKKFFKEESVQCESLVESFTELFKRNNILQYEWF